MADYEAAIVKQTAQKRRVGDETPGPGRPKGSPNKATASIKAAFLEAFERRGGVETLIRWADANETELYRITARLIPTEVGNADGTPFEAVTRIERVIVTPAGPEISSR